jgi:hypothetical protein
MNTKKFLSIGAAFMGKAALVLAYGNGDGKVSVPSLREIL